MFETLISIIPVEFKPMSIITLLLLFGITYILIQGQKTIAQELNLMRNVHNTLRTDFEKTKRRIDDEFTQFMNDTNEIKQSNKFILTAINEIKQDIRDMRNKK